MEVGINYLLQLTYTINGTRMAPHPQKRLLGRSVGFVSLDLPQSILFILCAVDGHATDRERYALAVGERL